jgi:hypothetical protein
VVRGAARALPFAALFLVTPAWAGGDASAAAEDLFQRAKSLISAGKWTEACPLLAESYRLDPAGATLQNLAVCHESAHQWASAYARFQELKTLAKKATPPRTDRVKFADEHLAKVSPKVSHLLVSADDATAEVEIEGIKYEHASWAAGIAIDPGAHDVIVSASGKKPYKTSVTIPNEGTEQKLEVPPLEAIAVEAPPPAAPPPETRAAPPPEDRGLRTTGFIIGGAGAALLGGAAVFGVLTIVKNNEGIKLCDDPSKANAEGYDASGKCITGLGPHDDANRAKSTARTFAIVTDVLAGVGVLAVGAGVYLAFLRGSGGRTGIRVAPTVGGAMATGSFW